MSSITEENKPSEPDVAVPQPEPVAPQVNQLANVSTQVNHKLPECEPAEAQPETTPPPTTLQKSTREIPLETNPAPFAYWSTQSPSPSTGSLNANEVNLQQQPQVYGLPAPQQPLALPEPVVTAETPIPFQSQPQHSVLKTPVHHFSYWTQGQTPDTELEAQPLQMMPPEHEEAKQQDHFAQPAFDPETVRETFAENKVSEEVTEKVTPKVARKLAKLSYWNPANSNSINAVEDPSQDASPDEEPDQDETGPGAASENLHLSPRRILRAARSVRGFENLGLHAIAGAGAITPETAALATTLIPLISELVRVEVELQLQAHNKQMEKERNAEYRSAYASVTPL